MKKEIIGYFSIFFLFLYGLSKLTFNKNIVINNLFQPYFIHAIKIFLLMLNAMLRLNKHKS